MFKLSSFEFRFPLNFDTTPQMIFEGCQVIQIIFQRLLHLVFGLYKEYVQGNWYDLQYFHRFLT